MKNYTIIAGVLAVLVLSVLWAMNAQVAKAPGGAQACTQEAKICPDGSAVGRTGPNCTFAACPGSKNTTTSNTTTTTTTTTTSSNGATLALGASATVNGTFIVARSLVEDSRCPVDVQCIQAGTVRVLASVGSGGTNATLALGQPQVVGNATVTLAAVAPAQKFSKVTVQPSDYRFTFTVVPSANDGAPVVGAGQHCGGFIRNAPVCATGFHCQLKISAPDTGGTCIAN